MNASRPTAAQLFMQRPPATAGAPWDADVGRELSNGYLVCSWRRPFFSPLPEGFTFRYLPHAGNLTSVAVLLRQSGGVGDDPERLCLIVACAVVENLRPELAEEGWKKRVCVGDSFIRQYEVPPDARSISCILLNIINYPCPISKAQVCLNATLVRLLSSSSSPTFPTISMPEPRPNQWPPPLDDTDPQSDVSRLQQEKDAKKINDEIDRLIEQERQELKKRRPQAKLLLLGQAEAGKSTLLKNFQLQFAPKAFHADADAWRAVIHLNLVRAVNLILELLTTPPVSYTGGVNRSVSSLSNYHGRQPTSDPLRHLRMRLSPLRQVELLLQKRLCSDTPTGLCSPNIDIYQSATVRPPDVTVRAKSGWKALAKLQRPTSSTSQHDELHDARQIIEACKDDIVALWQHEVVHMGLKERDVALEDHCTFFLDNAGRVAAGKYIPTSEDILRARLQTVGVEEHRLIMETDPGQEWIFYDVEGCRGQRAAWAPYFDDVNAVIFLCPMANFDRVLPEDPTVNSLLDSFQIWKTICESKLLADATFILLLNKMDLLEAKLQAGIQFSEYVSLYKDQPNDAEYIASYFKRKFSAVHKYSSPKQRPLHIHTTCAILAIRLSSSLEHICTSQLELQAFLEPIPSVLSLFLLDTLSIFSATNRYPSTFVFDVNGLKVSDRSGSMIAWCNPQVRDVEYKTNIELSLHHSGPGDTR
ncbi:hypothetical protein NM688_g4660 [Phlebia brevispora]|uniref:Uncharacterized protein n=1 Tax=Phlebia brevispora TaxID=194682 RepID=A0ACC1T2E2_9APHY|nr:hypothetical protein NM688_g4660 [Phlebia brevispora]